MSRKNLRTWIISLWGAGAPAVFYYVLVLQQVRIEQYIAMQPALRTTS